MPFTLRNFKEDLEDIGYKIGHPYPTVDPTGRFVYVSVFAPPWRTQLHNTAGIAKLNLETGAVTIIPFVGDNPIGMAHTTDGRYTYVNDSELPAIPGNAFGSASDGRSCYLRISYGALQPETVKAGVGRLVHGLKTILGEA